MPLPVLPTGRVVGEWYHLTGETLGVDGTVVFTPSVAKFQLKDPEATILAWRVLAHFDEAGNLDVELVAGDSDNLVQQGFTWTATFEDFVLGGKPVRVAPITFVAEEGVSLDLATVVPATATPGTVQTVGAKGDKGDKGDTGQPNQLTIGTVTEGPTAGATLVGAAPSQTLNIQLPVMSDSATALALAYAIVL